MSNSIAVVGSCMIDFITYSTHLPKPGETLTGTKYEQGFGGKGANQCITASRLGASTIFVCCLGSDQLGKQYLKNLKNENVDTSCVKIEESIHTGVAQIAVSDIGENTIVIVPGANQFLLPNDVIKSREKIQSASVLVLQFEILQKTVVQALKLFREKSKHGISIVNAAPAVSNIDPEIYTLSDIFCVNEVEAEMITGIQDLTIDNAQSAVEKLFSLGCKTVIITFGANGTVHASQDNKKIVHTPAERVKAVDTTGAGDAFIGALAFYLANHPQLDLKQCILRSNKIATKSVLKHGTQTSFPIKNELENELFL